MLSRGVPEQALLAGTELARGNLHDPYHLITDNQARIFYRNVLANADQDGTGMEIGWTTGLSDIGNSVVQAAAGGQGNRHKILE